MSNVNRRTFLAQAGAATVALAAGRTSRATAASESVVLAIVGANSRGSQLATRIAKLPGFEIAYICDCDERAFAKGIKAATSQGGKKPATVKDFRRALEDPAVDAIVCATPNHWHAPATILACAAGKHVYVEKPVSHTPGEGERMIAAARKSKCVVQAGLQRRSGEHYQKVVERVREGVVGPVLLARSWYFADRASIGRGKETTPPAGLDYDLWQGPVMERPFRDNLIHYNWHFFWHWGNGEIGNNGVHTLDICRWALGVDYPTKVSVSASKLRFDDDQETPDTCSATFDFDGRAITWDGISWSRPYQSSSSIGIEFRGEKGTLYVDDGGYTVYDPKRKVLETEKLERGDDQHFLNFADAIRNVSKPNADIEDGHKSSLLCHLGNIAFRTDRPLRIDPSNGHILNDPKAEAMWTREYRKGWLPEA
jgi:predicted dehydrogenase